jgi:hypothetical protein
MQWSILVQSDLLLACRGKVHWFVLDVWGTCNLYTFGLESEDNIHVGLTKLSVPVPLDLIELGSYNPLRLNATIDGKLSLLILHRKRLELEIWTPEHHQQDAGDHGTAKWLRTKVIDLKPKIPQIGKVSYTCLGQRSHTFIISDKDKIVYFVNLETGAVDDVSTQFSTLRRYNVVPFEMDWPAFFMSRLEAKKK